MKKRTLKLKKEMITRLDQPAIAHVKGGLAADPNLALGWPTEGNCTAGCSDGCPSAGMTHWNCTEYQCTRDCDTRTTTAGVTCFTASC